MSSRPSIGSNAQTSRFKVREREVEYRRMRGEASCAECRRCKLKCDKRVPCSSCLRRGCQSICPNGSLANAGTRFAFASSDKMRKKMLEMSQRICQLEDAVQILQASVTSHPHPLLSDDHLAIKSCIYDGNENEKPREADAEEPVELTDAFGTLAITDGGEVRFMGKISSEALLMSNEHKAPESALDLPSEILHTSDMFPFTPTHLPRAEVLKMVEARLPSYQRATTLTDAYFTHVAWFSRLVTRDQLTEDLLPTVFKHRSTSALAFGARDNEFGLDPAVGGDCEDTVYVHRLALLLAVLACGAAADLSMPVYNDEAQLYDQLARTALSLRSVFEGTSLESVQTVIILASYQFYTCRLLTFEPAWKTMIFGMMLGVSIGIHRDPSRWNMDPKLRERRRTVFWELFAMDKWKSLESGRPSIFNLAEADCEYPADTEAEVGPDGTFRPSYWRWKHMFAKEVMGPVAEFMALAKPVRYSEILELDRKVREFNARPIPTELMSNSPDIGLIIRRSTLGLYREIALLSLHRNFFARAMLQSPEKALGSAFSASVLAAYACSISLLKLMRTHYVLQSPILLRQWMIWIHSLIAGVIVGTVAVKKNHPGAVLCAQKELESAIELFEHAQMHPVARGGISILRRLLEKSRARFRFLTQTSTGGLFSGAPTDALDNEDSTAEADEALHVLGGEARTVTISTASQSKLVSATAASLAVALQARADEDASPPSTSTGTGSSEAGSSPPNAQATPPTTAEQPPQQSQSRPRGSRRGGGLFAVDSSEQSMFCPNSNGAYDDVGAGGSAPPHVVSERGGAAANALMSGDLDSVLRNLTANNLGIGTGADGMAMPPATPNEAYAVPLRNSFQGGELPQVPPLSDPITLFSQQWPETQPPSYLSVFDGFSGDLSNNVAGTGLDTAVDLDAMLGLETLEAGNNNFDFLMNDVLSSAPVNMDGSAYQFNQDFIAQSALGAQGVENGNAEMDTWNALMADTQRMQAANRAQIVPPFQS